MFKFFFTYHKIYAGSQSLVGASPVSCLYPEVKRSSRLFLQPPVQLNIAGDLVNREEVGGRCHEVVADLRVQTSVRVPCLFNLKKKNLWIKLFQNVFSLLLFFLPRFWLPYLPLSCWRAQTRPGAGGTSGTLACCHSNPKS